MHITSEPGPAVSLCVRVPFLCCKNFRLQPELEVDRAHMLRGAV